MKKITIPWAAIATVNSFYIKTAHSIWEKDAEELKKRLITITNYDLKIEEEHYKPENRKLRDEITHDSLLTLPRTPPTDIAYVAMSTRMPYNSKLETDQIRKALYFTTKLLEIELMNGSYSKRTMTNRDVKKINNYGITCFLTNKTPIAKRETVQRNIEDVIKTFYQ